MRRRRLRNKLEQLRYLVAYPATEEGNIANKTEKGLGIKEETLDSVELNKKGDLDNSVQCFS